MSAPNRIAAAGQAVLEATERLELLADSAPEAEFETALGAWFGSIQAFGDELRGVTGLSAAELAERLVP